MDGKVEMSTKLVSVLQAFLLINPQSESAMLNLQKMVEFMDERHQAAIYKMAKEDLVARAKRQIQVINEQIQRM